MKFYTGAETPNPLTLALSPSGRGNKNDRTHRASFSPSPLGGEGRREGVGQKSIFLAFAISLFATPALAAGGVAGEISPFIYLFSIFVMAVFVGYYVVWSVTPALHTPLMAVTNAISSVIVVGALLAVGVSAFEGSGSAGLFGFGALVMAAINIFGGFLVTQRMLAMYKKKDR